MNVLRSIVKIITSLIGVLIMMAAVLGVVIGVVNGFGNPAILSRFIVVAISIGLGVVGTLLLYTANDRSWEKVGDTLFDIVTLSI